MRTGTITLKSTGETITYPVPYDINRSSVKINALSLICDRGFAIASHSEVGLAWRSACMAFANGDPSLFASFDFVEGFNFKPVTHRYRYIPMEIKKLVLKEGKCRHCGDSDRLTVDHIFPVARGGSNEFENLQCLCQRCNSRKGARIE